MEVRYGGSGRFLDRFVVAIRQLRINYNCLVPNAAEMVKWPSRTKRFMGAHEVQELLA